MNNNNVEFNRIGCVHNIIHTWMMHGQLLCGIHYIWESLARDDDCPPGKNGFRPFLTPNSLSYVCFFCKAFSWKYRLKIEYDLF